MHLYFFFWLLRLHHIDGSNIQNIAQCIQWNPTTTKIPSSERLRPFFILKINQQYEPIARDLMYMNLWEEKQNQKTASQKHERVNEVLRESMFSANVKKCNLEILFKREEQFSLIDGSWEVCQPSGEVFFLKSNDFTANVHDGFKNSYSIFCCCCWQHPFQPAKYGKLFSLLI